MSYIFCNNNEGDAKSLYYIKADGTAEKVILRDILLFEKELKKINKQKATLLHLSQEQIKTLITSNGGYSPEKNPNLFQRFYKAIADGLTHVWNTENWLQMINPFRILLKINHYPITYLLFLIW